MEADPIRERELMMTRRQFFGRARLGVGTAALAGLLGPAFAAGSNQGSDSSCASGKAGNLLVHDGRPKPTRSLGLQAKDEGACGRGTARLYSGWPAGYRNVEGRTEGNAERVLVFPIR